MRAGQTVLGTLALGMAVSAAAAERRPVTLAVTSAGAGLAVDVVGDADEPVAVSYRLELDSRSGAGVNRTVQSGKAQLEPGKPRLLLHSGLGSVQGAAWRAVLEVTLPGGDRYRLERDSTAR